MCRRDGKSDNHGTFVELCQQTIDNSANGEAWCMAFVQSMIGYVENKLNVKSEIPFSENCLKVWSEAKNNLFVNNYPLKGAIVIWRHTKSSTKISVEGHKKYEGEGHTGFIIDYDNDSAVKYMKTLEVNTKKK